MDPRHADLLTDAVEAEAAARPPRGRTAWVEAIARRYESVRRAADIARGTCTRNRAASRPSNASPSSCATSSAASRCPAMFSSPRSKQAAACCWPSSLPRPVDKL